jgi:hypothetical protein
MKKIIIITLIVVFEFVSIECDVSSRDDELPDFIQNWFFPSLQEHSTRHGEFYKMNRNICIKPRIRNPRTYMFKASVLLSASSFLDSFTKQCPSESAKK